MSNVNKDPKTFTFKDFITPEEKEIYGILMFRYVMLHALAAFFAIAFAIILAISAYTYHEGMEESRRDREFRESQYDY